jgi:hypothetical protein
MPNPFFKVNSFLKQRKKTKPHAVAHENRFIAPKEVGSAKNTIMNIEIPTARPIPWKTVFTYSNLTQNRINHRKASYSHCHKDRDALGQNTAHLDFYPKIYS